MPYSYRESVQVFFVALCLGAASFASADTFEGGWDRPGYDYFSSDLNNPRAILCQWKCQQDARCKAWTYVKPGYQGPLARCWLKYAIPRAVQNSCCTSGYIGT